MYGSPLLRIWPRVRLLGGGVGALDEGDVGLRVVRAHRLEQAVDGAGRLGPREQPRQEGAQRGAVLRPTADVAPMVIPGAGRQSSARDRVPSARLRT